MTIIQRLYRWLDVRIGAREIVEKELTGYLLPRNINIWYSMGSILLFIFFLQVVTGMLLLVYYVPDADKAFTSVTFIMNKVPFGWLIRLCHVVGSNMMVLILFFHLLSTLFMGSYKSPRELNWLSGFLLFVLVMSISLTGYLLPWSQLSYWATTVATNSVAAIPHVGQYLVEFLRGGKLVGPPTLGRFFALHVAILPVAIVLLVGIHLFLLKRIGISSPPLRTQGDEKQLAGGLIPLRGSSGRNPLFPQLSAAGYDLDRGLSGVLFRRAFFRSQPLFSQGRLCSGESVPDTGAYQAGVVLPCQLPDPENLSQ